MCLACFWNRCRCRRRRHRHRRHALLTQHPLAPCAQADGSEEEKRKIAALEESLKQQGLDRQRAQHVLQAWREAAGGGDGKEVTPEDLRKVRWQVAGGRWQAAEAHY